MTQRWQEVWATKYKWTRGVFDEFGEPTGVIYTTCTTLNGHQKVIVPKNDNLKKHEGKRSCLEDGVPVPDLKVEHTYLNLIANTI